MKRLFEIEAKYYVMAEDEEAAQIIKPDLSECSVFAIETTSVDADWWDAIPYNGDDDSTCGQILERQNGARWPRKEKE